MENFESKNFESKLNSDLEELNSDVAENSARTSRSVKESLCSMNIQALIAGIVLIIIGIIFRMSYLGELNEDTLVMEQSCYLMNILIWAIVWMAVGFVLKCLLPKIMDIMVRQWQIIFLILAGATFFSIEFVLGDWSYHIGIGLRQRYEIVLILYFIIFTAFMWQKKEHGWPTVAVYICIFMAEISMEWIAHPSIRDFLLANIYMLSIYLLSVYRKPIVNYRRRICRLVYIIMASELPLVLIFGVLTICLRRNIELTSLQELWYQSSWARDIWKNASLIGGTQNTNVWMFKSYLNYNHDYFLVYITERFGILPCILLVTLYAFFFYTLIHGVLRMQKGNIDRQICGGCAIWLLYQGLDNIFANFGILPIMREYLPLSGIGIWSGASSIFVFIVYQSFYGADILYTKVEKGNI